MPADVLLRGLATDTARASTGEVACESRPLISSPDDWSFIKTAWAMGCIIDVLGESTSPMDDPNEGAIESRFDSMTLFRPDDAIDAATDGVQLYFLP
jgi:hypothetical protein